MRPENRSDGSGLNGSYFLKRKEEKYEMHVGAAAFLRTEIERHLPLFQFRKGNLFTYITTVYFDTEKLEFYQRARSFYDDNLKVRIKEYYYQNEEGGNGRTRGPGGAAGTGAPARGAHGVPGDGASGDGASGQGLIGLDPSLILYDHCFVELKQRIRGLVVKRRFEVPKRLLGRLLAGDEIWDELVASRSGIEFNGIADIYRDFRFILQNYHVNAKSIINYRRSVYQHDESELRITFDDEVAVYEPLPDLYESSHTLARVALGQPRTVFDTVIMEIKCQNGYPGWLQGLLQTHMPKRISKFTSSLNVLTQELPRPAHDDPRGDPDLDAGNGSPDDSHSGDTTQVSEIKY